MSTFNHGSPSLWWESVSEECPITLEPISSLPYPPYILGSCYYFDGVALASYIVSRGIFQNPLTREPLTREDCQRLDEYLEQYYYYHSPGESDERKKRMVATTTSRARPCVAEAFALQQSVQVVLHDSSSMNHQRRAQTLRNEATAALYGLFVYQSNRQQERRRRGTDNNNNQPLRQPLPRFGFDLHNHEYLSIEQERKRRQDEGEREGLRIIDDDEEQVVATDQEAWEELQAAFPSLATGATTSASTNPRGPVPSSVDGMFLQRVRETAARLERTEQERRHHLEVAKQTLADEAREQRNRVKQRQQQLSDQRAIQQQRIDQEKAEIQEARAEIEKWRESQWQAMIAMDESLQEQERHRKQQQTQSIPPPIENDTTNNRSLQSSQKDDDDEEEEATKREMKAAKAAAKRKRARERKKAKKKEEQKAEEERQRQAEIAAKKESSSRKCACCGAGILDCGFEKFGETFCSTTCARNGPK